MTRSAGAGAWGALLLTLLALPACRHESDAIVEAQTPHAVAARVGERFSVRLDANPTTGYRWRLATPPDPAVAALMGSDYEAAGTGLTGGGGDEVWTFAATGPGRTRLVLEYVRPWEQGQPPTRTHTLDVSVQSADAP
ncbi:MAG: protease inhibitor I42 family protein [Candidatus Binatia bacterium]